MFKKPAFYGVANVEIKIYKTNCNTLIFKPSHTQQSRYIISVIFALFYRQEFPVEKSTPHIYSIICFFFG